MENRKRVLSGVRAGLLVTITCCVGFTFAGTKDVIKMNNENQVFRSDFGYSFIQSKCWNVTPSPTLDNVQIDFKEACSQENSSFQMEIVKVAPSAFKTNDEFLKFSRSSQEIVKQYQMLVAGQDRALLCLMTPENSKTIDHESGNVSWSTWANCKGQTYVIDYAGSFQKEQREKMRKNCEIPAAFKQLLEGFKCD